MKLKKYLEEEINFMGKPESQMSNFFKELDDAIEYAKKSKTYDMIILKRPKGYAVYAEDAYLRWSVDERKKDILAASVSGTKVRKNRGF